MITEVLLNALFAVVNSLVNFLPAFDFSNVGGFTAVITSIVACSAFMPLGAFQVSIGIFLGIQLLKFGSSLLNWILRKILLG